MKSVRAVYLVWLLATLAPSRTLQWASVVSSNITPMNFDVALVPTCDTDWSQFADSCYRVLSEYNARADCAADCAEFGGSLLSIHSTEENDFIAGMLSEPNPDQYTFIGADCVGNGSYTWLDMTPWDFTNWMPGGYKYVGPG